MRPQLGQLDRHVYAPSDLSSSSRLVLVFQMVGGKSKNEKKHIILLERMLRVGTLLLLCILLREVPWPA